MEEETRVILFNCKRLQNDGALNFVHFSGPLCTARGEAYENYRNIGVQQICLQIFSLFSIRIYVSEWQWKTVLY